MGAIHSFNPSATRQRYADDGSDSTPLTAAGIEAAWQSENDEATDAGISNNVGYINTKHTTTLSSILDNIPPDQVPKVVEKVSSSLEHLFFNRDKMGPVLIPEEDKAAMERAQRAAAYLYTSRQDLH